MDPTAVLERIQEAYGANDYDDLDAACLDLLNWLRRGGFGPIVTESQLSALLIMARGYAKAQLIEHAPEYPCGPKIGI